MSAVSKDDRPVSKQDENLMHSAAEMKTPLPIDRKAVVIPDEEQMRRQRRMRLAAARTGGIYIPPHRLAEVRVEVPKDQSSKEYQSIYWNALKKSLNSLVNKVNCSNIKHILVEMFSENLIRGKGVFCRALMRAQLAAPKFTNVYAAIIAVINSKLPEIGELLCKRLIMQFQRGFRRNDKLLMVSVLQFIAHLVNQQVMYETIALEILTLLLENPTDDSVEVAVEFVKHVGQALNNMSPQGSFAIFERFRTILHEGTIERKVQYSIEGLFLVRRNKFVDYPAISPDLDLLHEEDIILHPDLTIDEEYDGQDVLNVFQFDPKFVECEREYEEIKKEIVGEEDSDDEDGISESESEEEEGEKVPIDPRLKDESSMRRTLYLTIMSSYNFEECAHKLIQLNLPLNVIPLAASMMLECCYMEKTFLKFYSFLGERFCRLSDEYIYAFDDLFGKHYETIHRFEVGKIRNSAKFFAHLLASNSIDWGVFEYIKLTEDDTTSASRIFLKFLFQELSHALGVEKLVEFFNNELYQKEFAGIFPQGDMDQVRFAINFFTSVGLGKLTDGLREHYENLTKEMMKKFEEEGSEDDDPAFFGNDEMQKRVFGTIKPSEKPKSESHDDRRRSKSRGKCSKRRNRDFEKTERQKHSRQRSRPREHHRSKHRHSEHRDRRARETTSKERKRERPRVD